MASSLGRQRVPRSPTRLFFSPDSENQDAGSEKSPHSNRMVVLPTGKTTTVAAAWCTGVSVCSLIAPDLSSYFHYICGPPASRCSVSPTREVGGGQKVGTDHAGFDAARCGMNAGVVTSAMAKSYSTRARPRCRAGPGCQTCRSHASGRRSGCGRIPMEMKPTMAPSTGHPSRSDRDRNIAPSWLTTTA